MTNKKTLDRFIDFIESSIMPPIGRLADWKYLQAIRNAFLLTALPLIMAGSIFLIIAHPPGQRLWDAVAPYAPTILIPFNLTFGILALVVAFGVAYSLAEYNKIDAPTTGVLALVGFLLTLKLQVLPDKSLAIPLANMGGGGLFVAIIVGIFVEEVMRFFKTRGLVIKMPESVPPGIARSFEAIIPAMVIITFIWVFTSVLNIDFHEVIRNIFKPLVLASDTLPAALIQILLITVLWVAGIQGMMTVASVALPIWVTLLADNSSAYAAGQLAPHIISRPFWNTVIHIGGSGGTLALALMLVFLARSERLKKVGKVAIIPSIFNVNEPIAFGVPIAMNPILAIPYIVGPVIVTALSYIAMKLNIVGRVVADVPHTLPIPISTFLSTGGDWRAVILVLINFALLALIYYPFFRIWDNRLLREEEELKRKKAAKTAAKASV